jgi:hypothetical protein
MNNRMKNRKGKKPLIGLLVLAGMALLIWVVMLLWNAILPDVLGVTTITYWQALGIFILSKILFGGFKGGPSKHKEFRNKFKNKFASMTDVEKESFKEEWKAKCRQNKEA